MTMKIICTFDYQNNENCDIGDAAADEHVNNDDDVKGDNDGDSPLVMVMMTDPIHNGN